MALTAAQRAVIMTGSRPAWATGMDMAWDFTTNRTWTANPITDTHSATIYAQYQNGVYAPFAANTLVDTDLGLQTVPTRTNSIRNNSMSGAVAGTPGTLPTNWFTALGSGVTISVVGTGTEYGLPYIDFGFSGTPTTSPSSISFESLGAISAATGQTWTNSIRSRLVSGNFNGLSAITLRTNEYTAGGALLVTNASSDFRATISNGGTSATQIAYTVTLSGGGTTAQVLPFISFSGTGSAINFTIRIYAPQEEQGAFASAPILTTSGAATVNGNQQVVDLTGRLGSGVSGIIQINSLAALVSGDFGRVLTITAGGGDSTNSLRIYRDGATRYLCEVWAAGVQQAGVVIAGGALTGIQTLAFACGLDYVNARFAGQAASTPDISASLPSLTQVNLGGDGQTGTNNSFQTTRRLALKFGAQNASTFADLVSKATLLAAVS